MVLNLRLLDKLKLLKLLEILQNNVLLFILKGYRIVLEELSVSHFIKVNDAFG